MTHSRVPTARSGAGSFVALVLALAAAAPAAAFNFGNMMNPGSWFGGGDRYDDYGPYGYPPPPPPAYGYGATYGAVPYAYAPAAATPAPVAPAPSSDSDDSEKRIRQLERRIQELEAAAREPRYTAPAAPAPGFAGQDYGQVSASPPHTASSQPVAPGTYVAPQGLVFRPLDLPDTNSGTPTE